ncbi:MAG: L,D-transpeptidase [Parachlamydiaceae bacterium]|nr:L,D-transpeptidase [Parachlamydiaceae bacterium]
MTFPKLLATIAIVLFGIIGIAIFFKEDKYPGIPIEATVLAPLEIELDKEIRMASPVEPIAKQEMTNTSLSKVEIATSKFMLRPNEPLLEVDRIGQLFSKTGPNLPIVETITYKSRVDWQKGRPVWLSDYATHYATSKHFIARSLNGNKDYFKQDLAEGDRFNVLRPGKKINFYLLIDTSRSKMWFYYIDLGTNERVLLKTYTVGLGRFDSSKASGMLTPLGKYSLGSKIAIYKPKMMGFYNGTKTEMIRVFGSRWLPFEKELGPSTVPAAGFGIHGVPWILGAKGELVENLDSLGKYESDGCVRLSTNDIEELFAIIITRLTIVELVKDYHEAKLPGVEREVLVEQ